jgi:hypothetical protein
MGHTLVTGLAIMLLGTVSIPWGIGANDRAASNPNQDNARIKLLGNNGGNKETDSSVLSGLLWLAKHQNPDGSWGAKSFPNQCQGAKCSGPGDEQFDIGLTGLSLLAFTGAGYTNASKDTFDGIYFRDVVRKAAAFLMSIQLSDGSFGGVKQGKFIYNQAIATLALTDLYILTKDWPIGILFKEPVDRAVKFLLEAQNPKRGWRYQPKDGQSDSSVTGWVALALKTAEKADIPVPPEAFTGIKAFYDDITEPNYGKVGYTQMGSIALMSHEDPRKTVVQPTMTAIGVTVRLLIDKNDPLIKLGVSQILSSLPAWDTSNPGIIDYYYWFHASACLHRYLLGPDGAAWKKWEPFMAKALLKNQRVKKDGCGCGSWDPLDRWSGEGSRVYCTAINVLTLETYYR